MVGDVLDQAFDLYKAHWKHLIGVALAFYLVASAVVLVLTLLFGYYGVIAGAVVVLIGVFWLTGALIEAVADIRDGRADLSLTETFARVGPRVLPLLGGSILAAVAILLGLALFIVPGLILLTWWSLFSAAIVLEGRGVFESFGRSRELVRGNGWSVFGVLVITYILTLIVSGVVRAIFAWLPDYVGSYIGQVVGGAVAAPIPALAVTVMYFRLAGPPAEAQPFAAFEPR